MYSLSVACLFRNEAHSIVEWIEHYLFHGVEHFYLIDDSSDDDSVSLLKPYIDDGKVTLFQESWSRYLGRQKDMYNKCILPVLKDTQWLLMVDMDEYMWSPKNVNLSTVLKDCCQIGQIQVEHTVFGSSGYESQPKSLVQSFTRRSSQLPTKNPGNRKYFVNTLFAFSSLNVHHATFVNKSDEENFFLLLDNQYFCLNHYCCQSRMYWDTVKCTRGDSDNYRVRKSEEFALVDLNEVEDTDLVQQNMPLYTRAASAAKSVDTVDLKE